jgi:hypothetical protein
MKAEKRHQLQRNALADGVGRLVQGMRSAPTTRSTMIWIFVVLAVAAVVVWQYGAHATQVKYSALWTTLDNDLRDPLTGPSKLQQFSGENRGTIPARSARFQLARMNLETGQAGLRVSYQRVEAAKRVNEARKQYKKLAGECVDAPLLAQEAMMGVAQAEESLVSIPGAVLDPADADEVFDLARALKSYQELARTYPDSFLGQKADNRAKEIEKHEPAIQEFYNNLNFWARKGKDSLPEPSMQIPPPTPTLPSPVPGAGGTGPDLPLPPPAPKADDKPAASQPATKEPAPSTDSKTPGPNKDTKTPPAKKADSKDPKSK